MKDVSQHLRDYVTNQQAFEDLKEWFRDYLNEQFDLAVGERKINHKTAALLGFDNYNQCKAYLDGQTDYDTKRLSIEDTVKSLGLLYAVTQTQIIEASSPQHKLELLTNYVSTVVAKVHSIEPQELNHAQVFDVLTALRIDGLETDMASDHWSVNDLLDFIGTTGLPVITESDDDLWFCTSDIAVHHQRIKGNMYATVSAFNRSELDEHDMAVMVRQINSLWQDFDCRDKYDSENLSSEFVGNWTWPKRNNQTISYSSSFRGKLDFSPEIRTITVINPRHQTIENESVVYRGLSTLYELTECSHIESLTLDVGLSFCFDGEAKLKQSRAPVFLFNDEPIIGNAILMRSDDDGDLIDSTTDDLNLIRSLVRFP